MIEVRYMKYLINHVLRDMDRARGFINQYRTNNALNLMLGTMAIESNFGQFNKQIGSGKALSYFQIEELTFEDIVHRYKSRHEWIANYVWEDILDNQVLSIMIARLKYWDNPEPIPDELEGQAWYWKDWYNASPHGLSANTYIKKYKKYITQNKEEEYGTDTRTT